MKFNPNHWKFHDKGQEVRTSILENLPADLETLCHTIQRSPSQVKRHLQILAIEGKIKKQGKWITAAAFALILLIPNYSHALMEPDGNSPISLETAAPIEHGNPTGRLDNSPSNDLSNSLRVYRQAELDCLVFRYLERSLSLMIILQCLLKASTPTVAISAAKGKFTANLNQSFSVDFYL